MDNLPVRAGGAAGDSPADSLTPSTIFDIILNIRSSRWKRSGFGAVVFRFWLRFRKGSWVARSGDMRSLRFSNLGKCSFGGEVSTRKRYDTTDVELRTPPYRTEDADVAFRNDRMGAVVNVSNLNKTFDGVPVLRNVSLDLMGGEVHALLGVNGSGKSTLIKILAGYHGADSGTITVNGNAFTFPAAQGSRYDPSRLPIAFVHQDLGLLPDLTVSENFHIRSITSASRAHLISWRRKREEAASALRKYGVDVNPDETVRRLSPTDQARVAILRACADLEGFAGSRALLVLDEPTVFLPVEDRQRVWELVRNITRRGNAVLLVSHELVDVQTAADVVTILRDGQANTKLALEDCDEATVVAALLGERLPQSGLVSAADTSQGEYRPAGAAEHASQASMAMHHGDRVIVGNVRGGRIHHADVVVSAGEIVGLTGLPGSGYSDFPYILYGHIRGTGLLEIGGQRRSIETLTPQRARSYGIALVPADRSGQAAFAALSASENIGAPSIDNYRKRGCVSSKLMKDQFTWCAEHYGISPNDPTKPFSLFSGGNQQKIVIAKWLLTEPRLILLHEPTQGVDIASKNDLVNTIRQAAMGGLVVLWCSIDQDDLARACDRVLVFRDGAIAAELKRPLSADMILGATYGSNA